MRPGILIVDDNQVIRVTLRAILRSAGFEVVGEAHSGEVALEQLESLQPRVICLDVNMPGLSGLEVLAQVRRDHPAIKVLMVTGMSDVDSIKAMIAAGAAGIIVKPFNEARITATILKLLT